MKKLYTLMVAFFVMLAASAQAPAALFFSYDNGQGWSFASPFIADGDRFTFDIPVAGSIFFHITASQVAGWDDINWSNDNVYFNAEAGSEIEGTSDRLISLDSRDTYYLYGTFAEGSGCSVFRGNGSTYRFAMDFSGENPTLTVSVLQTPDFSYRFHGNFSGAWDDEPAMTPQPDGTWTFGPVTVIAEQDTEFGIRSYINDAPCLWYNAPAGTLVDQTMDLALVFDGGVNIPITKGTWSFTLDPATMVLTVTREADPTLLTVDEVIGAYYLDALNWNDYVWGEENRVRGDNYFTISRGYADDQLVIRNLLGYNEELFATYDADNATLTLSTDYFGVFCYEDLRFIVADNGAIDVTESWGFVEPEEFARLAAPAVFNLSRGEGSKVILTSQTPLLYGREDFQDTDGWLYVEWQLDGVNAVRRSERPALPQDETYFDRKEFLGWEKVYLYAWNSVDGSNNKWPGEELTRPAGCDFFKAPVYDIYDCAVFNNGQGAQTEDIVNVIGGVVYVPQPYENGVYPVRSNNVFWGGRVWFDNSVSQWENPCIHYWGFTSTEWPGVQMTLCTSEEQFYNYRPVSGDDFGFFSRRRAAGEIVSEPEQAMGLWYFDLPRGVAGIQFTDGVADSGNESLVYVDITEHCIYDAVRPVVVIPGDVNGDQELNVSDVTAVVNAILAGSDDPAADANGDSELNVSDITFIVNLLLAE